jgi:predicted transcriptional regulator
MIQETSLFSYKEIKKVLSSRQKEVYEAIKMMNRPFTDKELATFMDKPINTITPRRGELVKMGLLQKFGKKKQDGRTAILWEYGKIV